MPKSLYRALKARGIKAFAIFCLLLTSSTAAVADDLRYLGESAEAFEVLLSEIGGAKKSIDMTYFIFNPSSAVTKLLLDKVIKKSREGVRVRLLLDANPHNERLQKELTGAMKAEGVEVRFFNPTSEYDALNDVRTHAKLALFDGERYITGGRNIEDDYYGTGDWMNYVDREVWVRGPTAQHAQVGFDRLWNSPKSQVRDGATPQGLETFAKDWANWDPKSVQTDLALTKRKSSKKALDSRTPIVSCPNVKFTFDDPDFENTAGNNPVTGLVGIDMSGERLKKKETTDAILQALSTAKKSMLLENYSFLPLMKLQRVFDQARKNGVEVTVVTNRDVEKESYAQSIQRSAHKRENYGTTRLVLMSRHGKIRDQWEAPSAKTAFWTIHGKTFVIDDSTTIVSSFNIDPRSYHTNVETAVLAYDCPDFARIVSEKTKHLIQIYEDDKSCEKCQKPTRNNGWKKSVIGWILYHFI